MLRGVPLLDPIEGIANSSGIRIRKVSLRRDWWQQDCGALLGFVEADSSPVALLPRSNGTYDCHYPSSHRRSVVTGAIASTLSRVAYVLYRPLPNKKVGGLDLLKFGLKGCQRELATIVLSSIAFSALGLILPVATGIVFDRLIPAAETMQLFHISTLSRIDGLCWRNVRVGTRSGYGSTGGENECRPAGSNLGSPAQPASVLLPAV